MKLTCSPTDGTVGVLISPTENPQQFADFLQAVPYFQVEGAGAFCFPVNLAAANIIGVKDGTNATIQLEFDGGDGALMFQVRELWCLQAYHAQACADRGPYFRSART